MSKLIEEAITEHAGERCPDFDPECVVCQTWVEYDQLKQMQEVLAFKPIVIEAVARVALEDPETCSRIRHKLDLSDKELSKVRKYLESLVEG